MKAPHTKTTDSRLCDGCAQRWKRDCKKKKPHKQTNKQKSTFSVDHKKVSALSRLLPAIMKSPKVNNQRDLQLLQTWCVCACVYRKKKDSPARGRGLELLLHFYHLQTCQRYRGNPPPRGTTAIIHLQRGAASAHLCARAHVGFMQTWHFHLCRKMWRNVRAPRIADQRHAVCVYVRP